AARPAAGRRPAQPAPVRGGGAARPATRPPQPLDRPDEPQAVRAGAARQHGFLADRVPRRQRGRDLALRTAGWQPLPARQPAPDAVTATADLAALPWGGGGGAGRGASGSDRDQRSAAPSS